MELEDQKWFPSYFRVMQTDFIGWIVLTFHLYRPLSGIIEKALARLRTKTIVDLCSGNGDALRSAIAGISTDKCKQVFFSDKFPPAALQNFPGFRWIPEIVDVLEPGDLPSGLRTMFNAFHHFDDCQKEKIVKVHAPHGLMICEILEPKISDFIKIFFTTTIVQYFTCFFVKPFRFDRIFFTCILPLNIFTVTWDGLVSVLKSEIPRNYEKILREFSKEDFELSSGSYSINFARVNWFLILPKS